MRVAFVSRNQHESLADLLSELHSYYNPGSPVSREEIRLHLRENLLAPGSPLRLMVATRDERVIGLAAVALLFSIVEPTPDKRKQCVLKEFYVRSAERGHGVGKALMAGVARFAVEEGCCRIDWPVQASNDKGIEFYERMGAARVVERLSYRLSGSSLMTLANPQSGPLAGQ